MKSSNLSVSRKSLQAGKNSVLSIPQKFRQSSHELSSPMAIAVCAMLLAVCIILSYFGNISITFLGTNVIKLSFTMLPIALAAMLYGPVCAGIVGGLSDIIGFMMAPMGAYIPGFTISMILIGFVYGIALYGEKPSLSRIAVCQLIISLFISTLLGSLWFVLFYGFQPLHALAVRGVKELVMYPVNAALLFVIGKALLPQVERLRSQSRKKRT